MLQTSLSKAYGELVKSEKEKPVLNYEIKMQDKFSKMMVQQMSMRSPRVNF
jgi:hypothetical protein